VAFRGSTKQAGRSSTGQGGGKRWAANQRPQSSSASRLTAGAFGFLTFSQSGAIAPAIGDIRSNPPRIKGALRV